jgi:hypothetical protein
MRRACNSTSAASGITQSGLSSFTTPPSKPPGCGSRRCRRRTWSDFWRGPTRSTEAADAASDWLGPEAVFEPQAAALEGNVAGPDGVRTFMAGLRDLYEVFEVRYTDVRDLRDRVLALGTTRSVARGSGIEQELTLAVVATYKDYGDKRQALEAAGLRE